MARDSRERARRQRNGMGHPAARVPFTLEAHAPYQALGFVGSPSAGHEVGHPELTEAGRAFRHHIAARTDEGQRPLVDGVGGDLDVLLETVDVWSDAITSAGSYPQRVAGASIVGGPHVGAGLTLDTASHLLDAHG